MSEGGYMLSPYATWRIKLTPVNGRSSAASFRALKEYQGKVDLQLEGYGSHLTYDANVETATRYELAKISDS